MQFSTVTYKEQPTSQDLKDCQKWVEKLKKLSTITNYGYPEQRSFKNITHFKIAYKQELKNLVRLEIKVLCLNEINYNKSKVGI